MSGEEKEHKGRSLLWKRCHACERTEHRRTVPLRFIYMILHDITQKNRDTARRMNGVERARGLRSENGTSKDRLSSTKDLVKTSDRISEHKGNTEEPSPC